MPNGGGYLPDKYNPPMGGTKAKAEALEHCRRLATQLGLTFVRVGPTHESAERFAIMEGRLCLTASDRLGDAEHFLYGYREAQAKATQGRD